MRIAVLNTVELIQLMLSFVDVVNDGHLLLAIKLQMSHSHKNNDLDLHLYHNYFINHNEYGITENMKNLKEQLQKIKIIGGSECFLYFLFMMVFFVMAITSR